MSNYRRACITGSTVFFTANSHQRRPIFVEPSFRFALRSAFQQTRFEFPFKINALVLLPDHLHCTWTLPNEDNNIPIRWSMIKRLVTKQIGAQYILNNSLSPSRKKRNESTIWQRRYWEHHILSEADYTSHLNYCYRNPVKHGLVNSVKDWKYSTFHRDVKYGLYPKDWCSNEQLVGKSNFGESVREAHPIGISD